MLPTFPTKLTSVIPTLQLLFISSFELLTEKLTTLLPLFLGLENYLISIIQFLHYALLTAHYFSYAGIFFNGTRCSHP